MDIILKYIFLHRAQSQLDKCPLDVTPDLILTVTLRLTFET